MYAYAVVSVRGSEVVSVLALLESRSEAEHVRKQYGWDTLRVVELSIQQAVQRVLDHEVA